MNVESLQDKATYKSKQQNVEGQVTVGYGFSASGSFSKSNINANYASVNEQSGVFAGDDGYQIKVDKNTDLKGALITSTQKAEDLGKNRLETGTLTSSDIHNISEYDAKSIGISGSATVKGGWDGKAQDKEGRPQNAVNKSIGFGLDSAKDKSTTHSGINTQNIIIKDEQVQQQLTGKTAEQTKQDILTQVTTDNAREHSGALANNFDKDKVQKEINTQVEVTKRFDQNRQEVKAEINKKIDQAKSENQSILDKQKNKVALTTEEQEQLSAYDKKVENYQQLGVLLDVVASGLSAPTNSGLGIATSSLSPVASYEIGQYFKAKATEGSSAHILAHTVLGAAVAAAGGNDALTAGLTTGGAEAAAPVLSNFLYGKKASDLTAEEKSTISAITGLVATGIGGAASGDISTAVQSGQGAQNAVENNDQYNFINVNPQTVQNIESIIQDGQKKGQTDAQIQQAISKEIRGRDFNGEAYTKGLVYGSVALGSVGLAPEVIGGTALTGAAIGGGSNLLTYILTTPKGEMKLSKMLIYTGGGAATGAAVTTFKNPVLIGGGSVAGAYSTQYAAEGKANASSAVASGIFGTAGAKLGSAGCGNSCQFTLLYVPSTATTTTIDQVIKKYEKKPAQQGNPNGKK